MLEALEIGRGEVWCGILVDILIRSSSDIGWSFIKFEGAAGDILVPWKENSVSVFEVLRGMYLFSFHKVFF